MATVVIADVTFQRDDGGSTIKRAADIQVFCVGRQRQGDPCRCCHDQLSDARHQNAKSMDAVTVRPVPTKQA